MGWKARRWSGWGVILKKKIQKISKSHKIQLIIIFVDHFYAVSQFPMEKSREEASMISSPPNK